MKKSPILTSFLYSVLVFLFCYFFIGKFFYGFDKEFLYSMKGFISEKTSKNIIVVEIDDFSYSKLGFPIAREDFSKFLNEIYSSKPSVIGLDILFLDKGKDSKTDENLAMQFKKNSNVIIGFSIENFSKAVLPYKLFAENVSGIGYFNPIINKITQKVYGIFPYLELENSGEIKKFNSFSFSVLEKYYQSFYGDKNYLNSKNIPIKDGVFNINFLQTNLFQRESFYNIYSGKFDKNKFKDKIVLVGYTAQGAKDDFYVPGSFSSEPIKGVYIHANVINNILSENYLVYFNKNIELFVGFLFVFFIIYFNISFLKDRKLSWILFGGIVLFIIISFLYFIFFIFTYSNSQIYIVPNYPFEFIFVLFLSFFISSVLKYLNEDKNKKMLSKALGEYVSRDIVNEILNSTGKINLAGENKKITIFFSDIAGFTTISEKMTPENLVSFLRIYLGEMSNIILDNKGFINKYEGDAIMALWGVFGEVKNFGIIESCKSALLQQKKLEEINKFLSQKDIYLNVRMGIHCGNAIIGNIGSEGRKMEFTALGDNVNLASRLEGVNKFYETNICVSQDVFDIAKDEFVFRYLDKIRVKGKQNSINIFELVGFKQDISEENLRQISIFENAIKSYQNKDFLGASSIFLNLFSSGDKTSGVYFKRCEEFLKNSSGNDWDGVFNFDEK